MKETIRELAETETGDIRGADVGTKYGLQPMLYLKEIMDAAKLQHFFVNFCNVSTAPEGVHDVIVPKRSAYEGYSGMTWNTAGSETGGSGAGVGPYANTIADISWTTLDNLTSVVVTPLPYLAGYALRKFDMRTNSLNLIQAAKEELTYAIGDRVDVLTAIAIGDAASSSSSATGAQSIYGGDATSDATLAAGDILTTDMVAEAAKLLQTKNKQYRANTGAGGGYGAVQSATIAGNPWRNLPGEPFVLFIGPAQEMALRKDSQFVNASEYGSDRVVRNGEIGEYLGIKVVMTNNVEQVASGSEGPDAETANVTVAMTRCIMMKARKSAAVVWGQKPQLNVFEYQNRDQIRIALSCAYAVKVIFDDAIVFLDVSDS